MADRASTDMAADCGAAGARGRVAESSFSAMAERLLEERRACGGLRSLPVPNRGADFVSNDYLGLARLSLSSSGAEGSSGARLLSGSSEASARAESLVASFHGAESALLYNSGYDANLGLISALGRRGATMLFDSLCHASIHDGARLGFARALKFKHNDLRDLERKLARLKPPLFVCVESIYSMDGDAAPLPELADLCERCGAELIVDEAHASGVFGARGEGRVCESGLEGRVLARVHTFGKALGSHGAAVVGPALLKDYLINFSRPFIYTTALPPRAIERIIWAYERLLAGEPALSALWERIELFRAESRCLPGGSIAPNRSPIQSLLVPGAERARALSLQLAERGFDARAIVSPTVAAGTERLRVTLHAYNTPAEIGGLLDAIGEGLKAL